MFFGLDTFRTLRKATGRIRSQPQNRRLYSSHS